MGKKSYFKMNSVSVQDGMKVTAGRESVYNETVQLEEKLCLGQELNSS